MASSACPDVVVATPEGARSYSRHQPETTLLYQVVLEHLSTFLAEMASVGRAMPRYVVLAFEAYLACGILACGFSRAYCEDCRRSLVVAFSCKKRGPCPSCGARRMASEAAFLVDCVLPDVAMRQWVLSLPFELRAACALRPEVLRVVHKRFVDAVFVWLRIEASVTRWLKRKGLLRCAGAESEAGEEEAAPTGIEVCVQTTLSLGEVGAVDERGVVQVAKRSQGPRRTGTGAHRGYSLHAGVSVAADDRGALERLLRYCARPAVSLARLSQTADGRYAYELAYPSAGRTHLVMTPMALLARLSALVAPPRYPLIRYSGVLAPAHALRGQVVRGGEPEPSCSHERGEHDVAKSPEVANAGGSAATVLPALLSHAGAGSSGSAEPLTPRLGASRGELVAATKPRLDWAELLRRTFDMDALACICGGRLRFIALVTERRAIEPLLESLGLPATRPLRARARAPTFFDADVMPAYD